MQTHIPTCSLVWSDDWNLQYSKTPLLINYPIVS